VQQFDGRGNAFLQNSAVPQVKDTHTRQLKIKIASTVCPETFILKISQQLHYVLALPTGITHAHKAAAVLQSPHIKNGVAVCWYTMNIGYTFSLPPIN
jgi:hypothetical protein